MTTHREQIITGLRELLGRQKQLKLDPAVIGEDTRLDRIGFDSISVLDFIYEVEDRFQVQIEMATLVRMERVQDLIDYLDGRAAG